MTSNSIRSILLSENDGDAMFYSKTRSAFLLIFLFACLPVHNVYATEQAPKKILILNSYHQGFPWTNQIVKGIQSEFRKKGPVVEFLIENMDTKKHFNKTYLDHLYRFYSFKYGTQKPHLIIAADDNALNFLKEYHPDIFPGIPVVFCGVNNQETPSLVDRSIFTGVLEESSPGETLDLALRLHPGTGNLVVIADNTPTGQSRLKSLNKIVPRYPGIKFIYTGQGTMSQLTDLLGQLPPKTIILFLVFFRDSKGTFFTYEKSMTTISGATTAPIYCLSSNYIGHGAVGGIVNNGALQGTIAAKKAMRILEGEKVEAVPILTRSPNAPLFDYHKMKQYNIKTRDIPAGSIILNNPPSFYEEHKKLIWGVASFIIFESLVIVLLLVNILARKRAEQALLDSEKKYRGIFENALEGIFQVTPNGDFITINPALVKIFGYDSPEEFIASIGKAANLFWSDPLKLNRVMSILQQEGYIRSFEQKARKKNGDIIHVSLNAHSVQDEKENVLYFEGNVEDISERKRLDEFRLARDAAEASARAKSEFLANMSHEIRTPMNSILGFTELLEGEINDEQHVEYLKAISTSGNLLLNLINDILDLTKIEAGKMELKTFPVNPYSFFESIKQAFSSRIVQKDVDFILEIDPGLPLNLLLDEVRLRQILFNLVGNAVKFTEQGYIKLSVHASFPDTAGVNDAGLKTLSLTFSVKDSGIGISGHEKELIFESFKQQDGQSSAVYGGTGLGLSITRRLVEMMKGKITVESAINKGSTFFVTIENVAIVDTANEQSLMLPASGIDSSMISLNRHKILLVDDTRSNRDLLRSWLAPRNADIIEAGNGETGIKHAREFNPDLILMDMKMPVMDGYEATRLIKNDPDLRHIPVIAITASAMKDQKQEILDTGCDGYLIKPVRKNDLFAEVLRFLPLFTPVPSNPAPEESGEKTEPLIPVEVRANIPELASILEKEFLREWDVLIKRFIINEIEEFALRLSVLAGEFGIDLLGEWAGRLEKESKSFNIEKIQATLDEFPGLIERIGKLS
ncbi:MAG: response regulator [bacterium]|nr:response regulator [bacterium]